MQSSTNTAILHFYRDLSVRRTVQRRCRVMLVGSGGAGKTTLAHRLVTGRPPDVAEVTHGVQQRAWPGRVFVSALACVSDALRGPARLFYGGPGCALCV
jgi:hypothetical protein